MQYGKTRWEGKEEKFIDFMNLGRTGPEFCCNKTTKH